MSGDHNQSDQDWRKRQIALDIKAENARVLGLDYEPDKTIMDMARESWIDVYGLGHDRISFVKALEAFAALIRADERNRTWTQKCWTEYERSIAAVEREACAKVVESHGTWFTTETVAAAIRARGTTPPAAQPKQKRNFCPRCGKRAGDYIHTCTPPQEKNT
jgi:hypothetical protein